MRASTYQYATSTDNINHNHRGNNMFRIMRYLSKAEVGQMLIALVAIVGQVYLDLRLPDYMSDITTLVETPGSAMRDIWIAGGKMLLVSLGSVACAVVTGFIAARVAASFGQRLRSMEFNRVESFGPAEMDRFSTASLITRSTNDITQIQMSRMALPGVSTSVVISDM